jgi:hypothetical protein
VSLSLFLLCPLLPSLAGKSPKENEDSRRGAFLVSVLTTELKRYKTKHAPSHRYSRYLVISKLMDVLYIHAVQYST